MKLLVSDLDGTLYPKDANDNSDQLERNFIAVRKWIKAGNKFVVATARGLHHYSTLIENLGTNINFIGANGAAVMLENGETIIKQIPCSVYISLCNYVNDNKINASVATGLDSKWLWSRNDRYPRGVKKYEHIWNSIDLADFEKINPESGVERIQIFTPAENRNNLKNGIAELNFPISITSSDIDIVDVGPLNCSKGISIQEICKRYDLEAKDIIVVGDSENDIPMFELTSHSYCIDSSDESVKSKATYTIESVEKLIMLELNR